MYTSIQLEVSACLVLCKHWWWYVAISANKLSQAFQYCSNHSGAALFFSHYEQHSEAACGASDSLLVHSALRPGAKTTPASRAAFKKVCKKQYRKGVTATVINNNFRHWGKRRVAMIAARGGGIPW